MHAYYCELPRGAKGRQVEVGDRCAVHSIGSLILQVFPQLMIVTLSERVVVAHLPACQHLVVDDALVVVVSLFHFCLHFVLHTGI